MTEAPLADTAVPHTRKVRREDGLVYKGMAAVVFAFVTMIVVARFTLRSDEGASATLFVFIMLLFDVGWDLTMRARGRGDMLASTATPAILAKALRRAACSGTVMMAVSYVAQDASRLKYVLICLAAWSAADFFAGRADR